MTSSTPPMISSFRAGLVAVVGRPNVGKSTLINSLLGQKIAAVSPRPQTTRRKQLGILSKDNTQIVFVDTPGIHSPRHKLGEIMNQEATSALEKVDAILWLVDAAAEITEDDRRIGALFAQIKKLPPLVLGINKIDLIAPETLPEKTALFQELASNAQLIPFSAAQSLGLQPLLDSLIGFLPERDPEYDLDQVTDDYEREIAADLIREACLVHLRDEVPHGIHIRIDEYTERGDTGAYIGATIFVERESQKAIVIGQGAVMLKRIGIHARQEIESMSDRKVHLELRVKVLQGWRDNEEHLRRFGFKLEKKKKRSTRS